MPPSSIAMICRLPNVARRPARPWRNGANKSRGNAGCPDSDWWITCIRPPTRTGTNRNTATTVSSIKASAGVLVPPPSRLPSTPPAITSR